MGDYLETLKGNLRDLMATQKLAVLATYAGAQPYTSLVAFAETADLKKIFFATTRVTRKYANLKTNSRVALLMDNRSNQTSDFRKAMAATAFGTAREVGDTEKEDALKIYLAKHPYLNDFVTSPTCALLQVTVERYSMVHRFQNVMEVSLGP